MMPNAPMSSVDEAKLFLQNKQLLAQMQANPALAFGPGGPKPAAQQFVQHPVQAFPKPQAPALNPAAIYADRPNQFMKMPDVLGLGAQNFAGLPGLQQQQQQQRPVGMPPNGISPAALMQSMMAQQQQVANAAAAQQAANAYSQQQQVRAAMASLLQQQQQQQQVAAMQQQQQQQIAALQQQQQQVAAMQQQHAAQQQAQAAFPNIAQQQVNAAAQAQNTAWINATLQRTLAQGQMQNKVPVARPGLPHQQVGNPNQAAAQVLQQLQAAAANAAAQQNHAQQVQIVKQFQAVLALQAKMGANQQQQQQQAAMAQAQQQNMAALKQAQLQDALAAVNSRAVNGGAKLNGLPVPGMQGQPQSRAQHSQVHQAQVQQRIRHNMAALANLTPAQLQTLGANPALAQALLQARAAANTAAPAPNGQQQPANGGPPPQQQQAQDQSSAPLNIPGAEALLASLRTHDARFKQQGPAGSVVSGSSNNHSPTSSVAGSVNGDSAAGSPPNAMNKEQRRMALACVALQLAHSGISVDQAIHSGIMGGMSVADVRFIVEVYNAEQARMKEQGVQPGNGVILPNGVVQMSAANGEGNNNSNAANNGRSSPNGSVHSANGAAAPPMQQQNADGAIGGQMPGGSHMSGGPPLDSLSADHTTFAEGAPDAFNALSYGFFGASSVPGELLGELESGLEGDLGGLDMDEMQAWMPEGAGELAAWADVPDGLLLSAAEEGDDCGATGQDDVASRLANLDLGSGFF